MRLGGQGGIESAMIPEGGGIEIAGRDLLRRQSPRDDKGIDLREAAGSGNDLIALSDIQLHRFFSDIGIGAEDEDSLHGFVREMPRRKNSAFPAKKLMSVLRTSRLCRLIDLNASRSGGDGAVGHVIEKRMVEYTGDRENPFVEDARFGKDLEPEVYEKVSAFGNDGAILFIAEPKLAFGGIKEFLYPVRHIGQCLGDDFDHEGIVCSEPVDAFRVIANEDELAGHGGQHLFGDMDTAAAFEGVQPSVELVTAIEIPVEMCDPAGIEHAEAVL